MIDERLIKVVSSLTEAAGRTEIALRHIKEAYQQPCCTYRIPAYHALTKTERALAHLKTATDKLVNMPQQRPENPAPELFQKIGTRYISERDIQAAISSGIQTATKELIAKIAALDAPKKGKA